MGTTGNTVAAPTTVATPMIGESYLNNEGYQHQAVGMTGDATNGNSESYLNNEGY